MGGPAAVEWVGTAELFRLQNVEFHPWLVHQDKLRGARDALVRRFVMVDVVVRTFGGVERRAVGERGEQFRLFSSPKSRSTATR